MIAMFFNIFDILAWVKDRTSRGGSVGAKESHDPWLKCLDTKREWSTKGIEKCRSNENNDTAAVQKVVKEEISRRQMRTRTLNVDRI